MNNEEQEIPMANGESSDYLKSIPYEDTKAAKPPIPITVVPPPPSRDGPRTINRPKTLPEFRSPPDKDRTRLHNDLRRDSGMAPSSSTARDSRTTLATDVESAASLKKSPSLPRITIQDETTPTRPAKTRKWSGHRAKKVDQRDENALTIQQPFLGITTDIPTGSFEDLTLPGQVDFSHRGSMLIGGKKANNAGVINGHARLNSGRRQASISMLATTPNSGGQLLSADDVMLSQKVRSMYEYGNAMEQNRMGHRFADRANEGVEEEVVIDEESNFAISQSKGGLGTSKSGIPDDTASPRPPPENGRRESVIAREQNELAGGIEDWEDIHSGDVDRYGFIVPRRLPSQCASMNSGHPKSPEPQRVQRVSTLLLLASEAPRRKRSTLRRTPSHNGTARSATAPALTRRLSGRSLRPPSSQSSYQGSLEATNSRFRQATNRLPYNKDRRWMDEAGDMLTLPPGLANIAEHEEGGRGASEMKRKEWEREEKWRRMAKVVKKGNGGGMVFEFDTKSPKLIERTWKGIPDRWRATAWHAFLTSSARKKGGLPSDDELVSDFHKLLDQSSPDDVQIDIDVPRTINSHIMFRRRYRGGQRLLFRVLHALSLYYPETGYVQGMASLVATLLCYYDEDTAFIMLVRLWQLRGLDRLYQSGFGGLMEALDEFEKTWLAGGEVAAKLTELGISPTAYGTRWYLTLFNYSIPFPAQLRVWDVFMLLGDTDTSPSTLTNTFAGGLDVLHATSAALIDGTREILLDSDFENAMKVLTSWIPIKDEELLMRVAKAEWKQHRRKR
ncbi:MAG: hypothetical protein M1830_004256 [Pleopsidium flavum]|nr:MAG: hypothetical protein M1830_004256 [Pleopsidium flavum]